MSLFLPVPFPPFEHPQISPLNLLFMLSSKHFQVTAPSSSFFLLINLLKVSLTLIPSTSPFPIHPSHCRPCSVSTDIVITSFFFRLFFLSFSFLWLFSTPSHSLSLASPPSTGLLPRVCCFTSLLTLHICPGWAPPSLWRHLPSEHWWCPRLQPQPQPFSWMSCPYSNCELTISPWTQSTLDSTYSKLTLLYFFQACNLNDP